VEIICDTAYAPVWIRKSNGNALRWGAGTDGAHGNNNTTAIQYPTALETSVGSGVARTDISKVAVAGSSVTTTRAVTWLLTTAGKIESSGSRNYGNGDGSALASAAVNTFQPAVGAIAALTVSSIVAGGGEFYNCVAITSTGTAYIAGYMASYALIGSGSTTNLNTFTALSGLPSGVSGYITRAKIAGGNTLTAIYLEAVIATVKLIVSIGYDGYYQTGKASTGVAAASQTWGYIAGSGTIGEIASWQTVGDHQVYGLEVLDENGELWYAGANDQGQAGTQPGNLHSVPYLQPCRTSSPRLLKSITFVGSYDAGTTYHPNDVVENERSSWINIVESTGNAPPSLPTESNTYWRLMVGGGLGYSGTSTTSLTVGYGSKTIAPGNDLAFVVGSRLRIASNATPTTFMGGIVTAYSGGNLTFTSDEFGGSGSVSDWNISLSGSPGALSGSIVSAQISDSTSVGRAILTAADAAAARSAAGAVIGTDVQAFDADLSALAANSTNGIWARTGAGTGSARTITGTAAEITVTNGDGVSGNPTLSIPSAVTLTGKTMTGGTFASPTAITGVPDPTNDQDAATKNFAKNASNLSSGTVAAARGGAGTVNGIMKANGSGVVSAATAGTDFTLPSTLASTANGAGAALVGIEDSGSYYSGTNVEAALAYLGSAIAALDQAVVLKGTWDASAGTFPGSGVAQSGWSYIVSVAGTVDSVAFTVGDRIVAITDNASTGTYASNWLKLDYTDLVSSVFGRVGAVAAQSGDYTASQITNVPAGNIAATTVQAALAELDSEKQPLDSDLTSWAAITRASGFDTFAATPSSANLAGLLTDETGSGAAVFAGSPALTGTPTAPTASGGTNTTQIATTAFVTAAVVASTTGVSQVNGRTGAVVIVGSDLTAAGYRCSGASDLLAGEEGIAFDFLTRTAVINDYADTLSDSGRPDNLLTVTRASTKMVVNRSKLLASVAVNTLAYDQDPVTGAPKGVLLEPAATNLLTNSEAIGSWIGSGYSVTSNTAVAPDGATTADLITISSGYGGPSQSIAFTSGTTYTISCWVKKGNVDYARVVYYDGSNECVAYFNLATGALGPVAGGFTNKSSSIVAYPNEWFRVAMTGTSPNSATYFPQVMPSATDSGGSASSDTIYAFGAQLETGTIATSYIPTTSGTATRSADAISIASSMFPLDAAQGTLFAEFSIGRVATAVAIAAEIGDGTTNERYRVYVDSDNSPIGVVTDGGSAVASIDDASNPSADAIRRQALAWSVNDFAHCYNGGTVGTDTSGTLPTVTTLYLGDAGAGSAALTGHIRRVSYISRRMANAELQAITA
jgi:hypothetical protein